MYLSLSRKSLIFFSAILLALTFTPQAHALELEAVAGMDLSTPRFSPAGQYSTTSSGMGYGVGALASIDLIPGFEAEIGAIFIPRDFSTTLGGSETQTILNSLILPFQVRYKLHSLFSVGLGAYFATGVGNVSKLSGPVGSDLVAANPSPNYPGAGLTSTDLGMLASARLRFPLLPTVAWFIDARYLVGVTNLESNPPPDTSFYLNQLQVFAGLAFVL